MTFSPILTLYPDCHVHFTDFLNLYIGRYSITVVPDSSAKVACFPNILFWANLTNEKINADIMLPYKL